MIRINLLGVTRRRGWTAALGGSQKVAVACSLILLAGAGTIGWRLSVLGGESARLDVEIADAQQEASRLHSIIAEVQQFEQRRAQLQQRVTLIEQLRKNQTGPVRLLDQISRALPPMVWLTSLTQSSEGSEITIEGRCTALTGLSDLIAGLEASGYFKRSVDIVSTQIETVPDSGRELIAFGIKATFQPSGEARSTQPADEPADDGT